MARRRRNRGDDGNQDCKAVPAPRPMTRFLVDNQALHLKGQFSLAQSVRDLVPRSSCRKMDRAARILLLNSQSTCLSPDCKRKKMNSFDFFTISFMASKSTEEQD